MTTHFQILETVRKSTPAEFSDLVGVANDDVVLYHLLFANVRNILDGNPKGLRLTKVGLKILRRMFQNWTLKMEDGFIPKPCHLLFFDRTCTMPWFLDTRVLVLFEPQLAMRAKLVGNIDQLLTAFS